MDEKSASPGDAPASQQAREATQDAREAAAPVARSIGERLRAGRERAGLSVAAAGEKLHLDPKIIEALEADRFAEVGASVYVRGHLKRYGDFVGEPGAQLVSMYVTRETVATSPDLTKVPHPDRRADPRRLVTPLVVLGCSALMLAAVWWALNGAGTPGAVTGPQSRDQAAEALPLDAPAPLATPTALTTTAAVPGTSAPADAAHVDAGAASVSVGATNSNAGAALADSATAPVREVAAREIRLRLELTSDSWVEIYDSRGERLFYDVASAGSVQSVSGRGPLRVVLGNAAGVNVQVEGQAREIPASAKDGEGARFVVNRSGSLSRSR